MDRPIPFPTSVTVTFAPGTTAPLASVTAPEMEPAGAWAMRAKAPKHSIATTNTESVRTFMVDPFKSEVIELWQNVGLTGILETLERITSRPSSLLVQLK